MFKNESNSVFQTEIISSLKKFVISISFEFRINIADSKLLLISDGFDLTKSNLIECIWMFSMYYIVFINEN